MTCTTEEPEPIRLAQALSLAASVREGMPDSTASRSPTRGDVGRVLGLPPDVLLRCRLGGWLHDIGKVAIPDRILAKRGSLDDAEWRIMRRHEIGEQLIARIARPERRPPAPCAITTTLSTAPAIPTGSPARRSRSRRGSWPSATPTAR